MSHFDVLRDSMNRLFGEFDHRMGGMHTGGAWDDDVFGFPLLPSSAGGGWNRPTQHLAALKERGQGDDSKMEDDQQVQVHGGQHQAQSGSTHLSTRPQAGHLQRTFKPDQIIRSRMNLEDQKDKFIFTLDVPSFDKKNVKISVSDEGLLTVKAEQSSGWIDESKNKQYLRAERSFANIERSVQIPKSVDTTKISANMENGVLHVTLPKLPEVEKKTAQVQIE